MKLETIYYISQTVSVVVIVATLFAVLLQMRQTAKIARLETTRAVWSDTHLKFERLFGDPYMGPLMHRAFFTDDELTATERVQISALIGSFLTMYENAHAMAASGLMNEEFWPRMKNVLIHYVRSPRFRRAWSRSRLDFEPNKAFQSEVDAIVAQVEADEGSTPTPTRSSLEAST